MVFNPSVGEKIAYSVVVALLVSIILLSTWLCLRRRNKQIKSRQPESIGLRTRHRGESARELLDRRPQPMPHAHIGRVSRDEAGFFRPGSLSAPYLRSTSHQNKRFFSESEPCNSTRNRNAPHEEDYDYDFTAPWARTQASSNAHDITRPVTIYPESSISSAPWAPRHPARAYQRYSSRPQLRAPSGKPPSPRHHEPCKKPGSPAQRNQSHQRDTYKLQDYLATRGAEEADRASYAPLTPPTPSGSGHTKGAAAEYYHSTYASTRTASHHPSSPRQYQLRDSGSQEHLGPPSRSHTHPPRSPARPHRSRSRSCSSPPISARKSVSPSTVSPPTDIAALVNPYYLAVQRQHPPRLWSRYGLESEVGSSAVGQEEWRAQGRSLVEQPRGSSPRPGRESRSPAQESPTPAPLRVGRVREARDGRMASSDERGRGEESRAQEQTMVLMPAVYRDGRAF